MTRGGGVHQPHTDPLVEHYRQRREALGLSQTEIAATLGTRQTAISEMERARWSPTLVTLRRWAEALDCDLILRPRSPSPLAVTDEVAGIAASRTKWKTADLTPTVLDLTACGHSARAIGVRLGMSSRTVERIRRKAAKLAGVSESADPPQTVGPAVCHPTVTDTSEAA